MAEITGVWSPLCNLRNAHLISGSHSVCSRHRVLLGLGTAQGNPTSLGGCWIRPLNDTPWLNRHFGGSWSVNTEKQQPMSGLLGCQCTHVQFFIHQNAQVFCKSVLSDFSQSVPMSGTALTQVNLELPDPLEFLMDPFLKLDTSFLSLQSYQGCTCFHCPCQ